MSEQQKPAADGGWLHLRRLLYPPIFLSGLVLAAIMALTVADVSLRYADAPLYGAQEITELAMVALIMLAIPYCAATDGHVKVDVLDTFLGRTGRRIAGILTGLISLSVLGFLIWNTAFKIVDAYRYADATNLLALPLWPIYALIAVGMAGFAIVVARDLIISLSPGQHSGAGGHHE